MKKLILFISFHILIQSLVSQNQINWESDLDYLAVQLPQQHYNLFTVHDRQYFIDGTNTIKSESKTLNDFQMALRIQQFLAGFGDSHTMLGFNKMLDNNQILPLHLLWLSDGIYILHTTPENKELLGRRILAINNYPVDIIADSISTLITADNKAIVKSVVPGYIPYIQMLEYFGFVKKAQVELTLDGNKTYLLKPAVMNRGNRVSFMPDSIAFSTKNENVFFTDYYYPEEKIYYIQYNKCWSKEVELKNGDKKAAQKMPSFKEFEKKAFKVLSAKPVDKIIFDIRYNGGGSSQQGTEFIEKLAKYLINHPDIKTYVVIGRQTFSSAILNAMDFKRLTNAVFVGEETSGKPNHFGEVRSFQLPSSNLTVNYSTKYFKRTEEDMNTIIPDISIEMSFSDFAKGIDPVYEWIKKQ